MEALRESARTPAAWRTVTLLEEQPGSFSVRFPFTLLELDRGVLVVAGLDSGTVTAGLGFGEAVALGERIEAWAGGGKIATEGTRKPRKRMKQAVNQLFTAQ